MSQPQTPGVLEAELRRYRTMVEHAAEGICVGQGGLIRFANARCLALLGATPANVGGRPMIEYVHPDDRAYVTAQRDRRARGERVPAFEARYQRDDGSISWVEINGVVVDWEGAPANLFFLKDTTERHFLDEELKNALAHREAMLDTSAVGVTFLVNRRHQWLNRTLAQMLGYEPAELLGLQTRVHYASDADFEQVGDRAYAQIANTGRFSSEVRMQRKDGSLIWVQIDGTAIDRERPESGTVWTYVDMTARKVAEQEVRHALERERELGELKSRLVAVASHELRTPLAAILSTAELLTHYGDRIEASEQHSMRGELVLAARRMQQVLDEMLTLGEANEGKLKQRLDEVTRRRSQ